MSGRLVGEVLACAPVDLTLLQRFVLVALAESARDSTRRATYNTSCEQIAERIGSTPSSVKTALFELRQRGLIIGLHDKPRRGLAQEYDLAKLTPDHRRATRNGLTPINPDTG